MKKLNPTHSEKKKVSWMTEREENASMIILSSISHQGMKHIWWWSMHRTTCREQHPLTPSIPCIVHLAHWFTENHQLIHDLLHPLGL
jgi:hypothetical protein